MARRRDFLAAAASLGAVGAARTRARAAATITIASTTDDTVTPVLYAVRAGLFEKAGLAVTLDKLGSGTAITSAVLAGAYNIGKSSILPLFHAYLKGLPVDILAPAGVYDAKEPFGLMLTAHDSSISSAKDLNGKIVGTPALDDVDDLATVAWVARNGGDWKSLRFVEMPMSAALPALVEHRLDAMLVLYPTLAAALAGGQIRVLGPAMNAIARAFPISAWFTSKNWAAANPDTVRTFIRVLRDSAVYTNAHHDVTAPILSDFSKIPPDVVQRMFRVRAGTVLRLADLQPLLNAAVQYEKLPSGFALGQIVDPAALQ